MPDIDDELNSTTGMEPISSLTRYAYYNVGLVIEREKQHVAKRLDWFNATEWRRKGVAAATTLRLHS